MSLIESLANVLVGYGIDVPALDLALLVLSEVERRLQAEGGRDPLAGIATAKRARR